jgi:hypothetical protein
MVFAVFYSGMGAMPQTGMSVAGRGFGLTAA